MKFSTIIIGYFVIVNIAGLMSMAIDKAKAIHNKWRIPEKTLFMIAMIGGSVGSIMGMQMFRHKTKHNKFTIGMPAILFAHIVLALVVYFKVIV